MAFGGLDRKQTAAPMADINMTPLIDVMLVLLVIFIITAPLFTHAIKLDLPKVASAPSRQTPQTISLSIDAAGKLYWDSTPLTLAMPGLSALASETSGVVAAYSASTALRAAPASAPSPLRSASSCARSACTSPYAR